MMQKHRISTNIGKDQKVTVELNQDYDLLEILSLKFTQQEAYTSLCSDYGVVCGRISVNNGFGVPNARVSIFVPLSSADENDPVISKLYPYKSITDKGDTNHRYNLLPSRKQHGGHEPTGTFFDQSDILSREEVLEVYEKYYTYTVKTNTSGDFMIWGVPLGEQIIHVDVDLSDIGCFSLRPDDFIRLGEGVDKFKNTYSFKSSEDIDSLPQIVSFQQSINVYPFWGNQDLCEIGITRTDFDLSSKGVKIEPKAYFLGSVYSDQGKNSVNKNCTPKGTMGQKCSLISGPAVVEIIRFSNNMDKKNRPILEKYEVEEDVDEDGSFVLPLPMNLEYVYTDDFGDLQVTNDPNKGIATTGVYRFRITMKNEQLGRVRVVGSYLVPNIREYNSSEEEMDKSYTFSLNWDDYPTEATNTDVIFDQTYGSYYPKDYFYRMTYNKVYGVSSFMGSYFSSNGFNRHTFLGIKEIAPKDEDDCDGNVVTPPVNWGIQKFNFGILLAIIINIFERIIYTGFVSAVQVLIVPFQVLYDWRIYLGIDTRILTITIIDWYPFRKGGLIDMDEKVIEPLQQFGTVRLGISIYPECETCDNLDYTIPEQTAQETDPEKLFSLRLQGSAFPESFVASCFNISSSALYFSTPPSSTGYTCAANFGSQIPSLITISNDSSRYIVKFSNGKSGNISLVKGTRDGIDYYYFIDNLKLSHNGGNPPTGPISYKIFDSYTRLTSSAPTSSGLNSELEGGCQQYVTVYNESIVKKSYCVTDPSTAYKNLPIATNGFSCSGGKVVAGQVIGGDSNPCGTCDTKSGFSEFRYGLFTIVPAAKVTNWTPNIRAIGEYTRRKLVGKLFCEGVVNYSFLDNWLTGSLYFFPFKAKVRWDDEATLDLNYRSTDYCKDLVYFKVGTLENKVKRFYYRSAYTVDGNSFTRARSTMGHPTTIVDLGPRDEFIKEICTDPSLDPNCSVVRNIGPSSYQDFKEMLGLYINYKMDTLGVDGDYTDFFDNNGFNYVMPNKMDGYVFNGDALQLISINSEAGIEEFDLQNPNYSVYNPRILDAEQIESMYGVDAAFPINFALDKEDGYRVRVCLNEPGRLTESSQPVPFYLWDKGGSGFGSGIQQHWDYNNIQVQPLQGMTYGYVPTGDTSHKYVLFPMTKEYDGMITGYTGIQSSLFRIFDVETIASGAHNDYDNQEEGFTVLEISSWSSGTTDDQKIQNGTAGTIYTRVGDAGNWVSKSWVNTDDYFIKPTSTNYGGNKQILSTPFLYYFGLRPGKTAVDKFMYKFGPKGAFPTAE